MVRRIAAAALILVLVTAAHAARPGRLEAPPLIYPDSLRAHVAVLASDDYEGRYPGTAGGRKTEAYLVDSFTRAGLTPAAPGGGWLQPVAIPSGLMGMGPHGEADNIIGKVAGSDPGAGAVLITAHWDHLGRCRTFALDRICNGAVDNASGVAVLIEIARAVAAGPRPTRDVIFMATTGEEEGELGARTFAAAPSVPLASIVAAFNFDCPAIASAGAPVAIIGRGRTKLDPLIFDTARALGRKVDKSGWANRYLERQDGWQFLTRHVPAVMFGGAFGDHVAFEAYMNSRYHTPRDALDATVPFDGAAQDAELAVALVRIVADPARWPAR